MRLERTREAVSQLYNFESTPDEVAARMSDAAFAEVEQAEAVLQDVAVWLAGTAHHISCGQYANTTDDDRCDCGLSALRSALAAFGSGEGDTA